ncbi:hypothetical protein PG5_41230 [Pseudomonas sp. G5(2012)]|nr:hypothetical protein PG5_41230 [Pseudomonas sp. G5(2012)]
MRGHVVAPVEKEGHGPKGRMSLVGCEKNGGLEQAYQPW